MVNFESDETAQEREIDYKTQEITELFRHAEALLKKFSRVDASETIAPAELTVRTNIQRSIAKRLQTLSMSFRNTQKVSLSSCCSIALTLSAGVSHQIENTKIREW